MYYEGRFKPENPQKYLGDPANIIYRSRLELVFCSFCDRSKNIISWASEEFSIPYRSPIDGRYHRYYPDFFIIKKTPEGNEKKVVIEIKPEVRTKPPKQEKNKRRYLYEIKTWGVNSAKWKAAQEFCKNQGWEFQIITEKELGLKF